MKKDKKILFKKGGIYFILLLGCFLFLEPNIRGGGGVHTMNTLGKLTGFCLIWLGLWGIFKVHSWLMPFRDFMAEQIPLWKLFSYIFFGTALLSGTMGFIARKSFGIAHVEYIDSMGMWLLEGLYAMIGLAGVLFTWIEPDKVFPLFQKIGWKEPESSIWHKEQVCKETETEKIKDNEND